MTSTKGSGLGKRPGSQSRGSGSSKNDNQYNHDEILEPHTFTPLQQQERERIKCYKEKLLEPRNPSHPTAPRWPSFAALTFNHASINPTSSNCCY
jgi:hypothetical protein